MAGGGLRKRLSRVSVAFMSLPREILEAGGWLGSQGQVQLPFVSGLS